MLAAACALGAQEPRFDTQSRLVIVPVTVTDAKGQPIDGLGSEDFSLLDNGRAQKVTLDTAGTGVAPIALVVAIQASGISKPVLEKVSKLGSMIQPLVTGERGCAGVLTFAESVVWLQDCTQDPDALTRAFTQIRHGEAKSGRMLDAVHEAVGRLAEEKNSRRVLLLISESRDRGSKTTLEEVSAVVQSANVTVYSATYSAAATAWTTRSSATAEPVPPGPASPPPCGSPACVSSSPPGAGSGAAAQSIDILGGIGELARLGKPKTTETLAKDTGGTIFSFTRLKGLQEAIEKLGEELHSQYVLSFAPDDRTAGYHHLEVRVADGQYRVRARPGYWSTQDAGK